MSEQEEFLKRWSRRKREAESDASRKQAAPKPEQDREPASEQGAEKSNPAVTPEKDSVFDPESLPPLDSITAGSDIRAFLAPGVPDNLKYAALRKMWTADADIRDFIGLVENGWDFNASNSAHGFGPLEITEELKRAVAGMFERASKASELQEPAAEKKGTKERNEEASRQSEAVPDEPVSNRAVEINNQLSAKQSARLGDFAVPREAEENEKVNDRNDKRGHGSALPK